MVLNSLYVTPRAKTISPLGRMSSCHSIPQQCCLLKILEPLPKPSPLTLLRPAHGSFFQPGVCLFLFYTNDTKQVQWQTRHFRLHYAGLAIAQPSFLRQNGEILSVVLISAILISLLSAAGVCFPIEREGAAANHNQMLPQWNHSTITPPLIWTHFDEFAPQVSSSSMNILTAATNVDISLA